MNAKNLIPLLVCGMALSVTACERKGPMERAGEKADHAMEKAADKMDRAADELHEEADKARDKINDAARK